MSSSCFVYTCSIRCVEFWWVPVFSSNACGHLCNWQTREKTTAINGKVAIYVRCRVTSVQGMLVGSRSSRLHGQPVNKHLKNSCNPIMELHELARRITSPSTSFDLDRQTHVKKRKKHLTNHERRRLVFQLVQCLSRVFVLPAKCKID